MRFFPSSSSIILTATTMEAIINTIISNMQPQNLNYLLSEHPKIVGFRWSPTQTWFSTWFFLVSFVASYVVLSCFLHITLSFLFRLLNRQNGIPLGPIPAIHSLVMSALSATIFAGTLLSAAAEIRDTRWLWHHAHLTTSLQWLLCFPLGTRPSGRVFYWSYAFYITRFLHVTRTLLRVLRNRRVTSFHVLSNACSICMAFLWIEFSQSFQVLAILLTTSFQAVAYACRFLAETGTKRVVSKMVVKCQLAMVGAYMACHVGVLVMHYKKGGCSGVGPAWAFNTVCSGVIMGSYVDFFLNVQLRKKKWEVDDDLSTHYIYSPRFTISPSFQAAKKET